MKYQLPAFRRQIRNMTSESRYFADLKIDCYLRIINKVCTVQEKTEDTIMTKKEKAIELHDKGFNCAQAVACAFAEKIGMPEETLFAACEGFGLGMGGMAATCGAVSGAVMLAGLKNSCKNLEQPSSKADTYKLTREITKTFLEKNGSLTCGELKGVTTGKVLRSCPDCIRDAVEIAEDILKL